MVLALSLISAGVASLATAKYVETKLLKEFDQELQRQLEESVSFLEQTGKAEPTEEYEEKRVIRNASAVKPPLDEVVNQNHKVRYDQIVSGEAYVAPEDGTIMVNDIQEVCDNLPEIFTITTEEFMENESGFDQCSLTYFADGGVLDEEGELVVDFEDMIGNTRPPFGDQSGEPHIVYLRNTRLKREFEVIEDDANAKDILEDVGRTT
jgi:hypothetical protein